MKQNPRDIPVQESLRAGILARDGFLGEDGRPFPQIIQDDTETLAALHITPAEVAQEMRRLTGMGIAGNGTAQADGFQITVEEYMGRIGCPFRDHRAAKRNTTVTDLASGRSMAWSDLSIHLIAEHGFFQGKGSAYRLEPAELADFLKLA